MGENETDKIVAMIQHIAKSLGNNETMVNDILQTYSTFDNRLTPDKLSPHPKHPPPPSSDLHHSLDALHRRISHHLSSDHPIWSNSASSSDFLNILDRLISILQDYSSTNDESLRASLLRADDLLQKALFKVEDEFRSLMQPVNSRSTDAFSSDDDDADYDDDDDVEEDLVPVAQPVTDFDIVVDALPPGTVNDLHEIAKRMVAAGFSKECSHVYSASRREFLGESLSRIGLQKLSIDEVHKLPWEVLEDEIERWIKGVNLCMRILFPSERRLCDRVFFGLSAVSDLAFMEVCRGSTVQLLNFVDAVAIGSRAPERLFKVLDVFETLRDLIPEFEGVFSDQYCVVLKMEAVTIWKRLGEAIRGIFMELENLIRRDPPKALVPGGGLHPITRYVMNYLLAACRSRLTLEQVFEENLMLGSKVIDDKAPSSSLSVQMTWIMELLQSNLEEKSKVYRDSALSSVFMMNNGRYIVQKVKDSELGLLLGNNWIRKHAAKIKQYHLNYQRSSWNKVVGVLKMDNGSLSANGGFKSMKEKLKLFNTQFEETCKVQSTWIIHDEQLKEELKSFILENLVPAYRSFVGRFQNASDVGKNVDKYVKYGVEDVEARINRLFQGTSGKK